MPRSPTKVTAPPPKRLATFSTCEAKVLVSWVLPGKTSMARGYPAALHSKPTTICNFPRFLIDDAGDDLPQRQPSITAAAEGDGNPQAVCQLIHQMDGAKAQS